ncbi:MAG: topoisomerase DNA-binding C4 zinc finger domain-containing protein, partial [Longimicrobiales bacterium]|nr:topoisomerase DNA-binding C4 zinc finger domain-containing protein [Longimicrobiales bacterium]
CKRPMQVRWNKFGRFLGCSGYPECQSTRPLDAPEVQERGLGVDPGSGLPVLARVGPYGPYVQLGDGEGKEKPKRVSLPEGMALDDVSLNYGLLLLSLPRSLGKDPKSGKEVTVGIGRYGPYVHRGGSYRNLKTPALLFEMELDEALKLLETTQGREVLKEMGPHPDTGIDLKVLDGRYGPYVTDGTLNASLPKGADPKELVMEEAVDLLAKAKARKGKGKSAGKKGGGRGGVKGRSTRGGKSK